MALNLSEFRSLLAFALCQHWHEKEALLQAVVTVSTIVGSTLIQSCFILHLPSQSSQATPPHALCLPFFCAFSPDPRWDPGGPGPVITVIGNEFIDQLCPGPAASDRWEMVWYPCWSWQPHKRTSSKNTRRTPEEHQKDTRITRPHGHLGKDAYTLIWTINATRSRQNVCHFFSVPYRFRRFMQKLTSDAHSTTYLINTKFDGNWYALLQDLQGPGRL